MRPYKIDRNPMKTLVIYLCKFCFSPFVNFVYIFIPYDFCRNIFFSQRHNMILTVAITLTVVLLLIFIFYTLVSESTLKSIHICYASRQNTTHEVHWLYLILDVVTFSFQSLLSHRRCRLFRCHNINLRK